MQPVAASWKSPALGSHLLSQGLSKALTNGLLDLTAEIKDVYVFGCF